MEKAATITSTSPEETEALGRQIASLLRTGDVVSLAGDLGAGKTVFARGVCGGLGYEGKVKSPSFIIVREYEGRVPILHIDLYRLTAAAEWTTLGVEDRLEGVVTLIEWPDRLESALGEFPLTVEIDSGAGEEERVLRLGWSESRFDPLEKRS